MQSIHDEHWVNPEVPTSVKPFDATTATSASVPAITFGRSDAHVSANTLWEVRVGRFDYSQDSSPSSGNLGTPSQFDSVTGVTSGAPQQVGERKQIRTTAEGNTHPLSARTVARRSRMEDRACNSSGASTTPSTVIPTGPGYIDNNGQPSQSTSRDPVKRRRSVHHDRRVRKRRHDDREPADDQCRPAFRPYARHQSGSARARCRTGTKPGSSSAVWARCTPGISCRRASASTAKLSADGRTIASCQLRKIQPGRGDRRARLHSIPA